MQNKQHSGDVLYKCRKCGSIDDSLHVPNLHLFLLACTRPIGTLISKREGRGTVSLYGMRYKDGCMGITDLIGGNLDEESH